MNSKPNPQVQQDIYSSPAAPTSDSRCRHNNIMYVMMKKELIKIFQIHEISPTWRTWRGNDLSRQMLLSWKTLKSQHLTSTSDLILSNSFLEVTLIYKDRKPESHKFVLPRERNLRGLNEPNPQFILSGVQHQEMETLLQFMYRWEATFYQDWLNQRLKMAKHPEISNIRGKI